MTPGDIDRQIQHIKRDGDWNPNVEIRVRAIQVPKNDLDCSPLTIDGEVAFLDGKLEVYFVDIQHA